MFRLNEVSKITRPEDAENIVEFVREAIEYLAMVDYPYASDFLKPLPAWPVKVFFSFIIIFKYLYKKRCNVLNRNFANTSPKQATMQKS